MGTTDAAARVSSFSFDRVADEYEATRYLPGPVADATAQRVLTGLSAKDWYLDAGVGTGRFARALARRHTRTVGVDISRRMMREMRVRSGASPHLLCADLRRLPFADAAIAGVLAVHVFHLIPAWQRALAEMWRVLRPGGALHLAVEDGARTQVRSEYLRRAHAHGALPAYSGGSIDEILSALTRRGAAVREVHSTDLCWSRDWSAREMLGMLERRTYSLQWDIPEPVHQRLLVETRDWTLQTFGTLDVTERIHARLVLYEARK